GKGSISSFIAEILSQAGYTVGRYVSPAVTGYCEKIQFVSCEGTEYISKESASQYITSIKKITEAQNFCPTEFEIETLMSLLSFRDREVDYVILECGMGGMYDATNAVSHKEMCVFVPIDYDHMRYLGNTIAEITKDKSGIMVPGCKVVSAAQCGEARKVLDSAAKDNSTKVVYTGDVYKCTYSLDGTVFEYKGKKYETSLAGIYQPQNAAVGIEAATLLLEDINYDVIKKAVKKTKWPGRFEIISRKPFVIYDGAHNPAGVRKLTESVDMLIDREEYVRIGIMGAYADKDIRGMAGYLSGKFDEIHTVTAEGPRAGMAEDLAAVIDGECNLTAIPHPDMMPAQVISELEVRRKTEGAVSDKKYVYIVFGTLSLYGHFE
ncbi:MAG: hypothetical protein K2K09_00815, partial [Lachnospiraceae bacterium]|nr:hypothetical protein [Lachnospiraceae bacterium]